MPIKVKGASEHNLKSIDADFSDGLTVVTGVSGSGKTSLVFDALYHEARRRFLEIYALGSSGLRLSPAAVEGVSGLGPALAVGQNLLNRNPLSTLATASGLHPFLRLLYARFGERRCVSCGKNLALVTQDEAVEQIAACTTGTQVFAPLLRQVCGSHATLLSLLEHQFGARALRVDGKVWDARALRSDEPHDIEVCINAVQDLFSPHEARQVVQKAQALGAQAVKLVLSTGEEKTLALAPVCSRCGTWFSALEPVHFHLSCPHCAGAGCERCANSGMHPQAAFVHWHGMRLPQFLALSVTDARNLFDYASLPVKAARLRSEILRRFDALEEVGLGYITLDRPSPTLSRGEAQRVRLAVVLTSRLNDMLHVFDEPTIGQHPADVQRLLPAFRRLAGPVVYVEHDRQAAAEADSALDLGPGAGTEGGNLLYSGTPAGLWQADTPTGRFFSRRSSVAIPQPRPASKRFLKIRGAHLHNLKEIDVSIPLGRLSVVSGVSGSGKSTLVEDVLVQSLGKRQPVGCHSIEGTLLKVVAVDQEPIGRNPRSNPATYTKLADLIRDLFASQTHLTASHFSFNRPVGACPVCGGMGAVEVSMRYLPSTWITCATCEGERFSDEVLAERVSFYGKSLSIAEFYRLSITEALDIFRKEERLSPVRCAAGVRILEALQTVGLGYLTLGQPSPTLSGGEAQRVKLSKFLGRAALSGQLLVLDEPSTGLHPQDLAGLLTVLDRLVRAGATVLVVEHNLDILRAADWVIDLGPGAGPDGGQLLYAGPPAGLKAIPESKTGKAMCVEEEDNPRSRPVNLGKRHDAIQIRGARAHNLKDLDVDFPKGAVSVVTGVSGSGKSSLVGDVLEVEARRRFLESLSLYERQGVKEGGEAEVDSISGLGVTVTITPESRLYERRATVGTASEIDHHLAVLLALVGERTCLVCGSAMQRKAVAWQCSCCGSLSPFAYPRHFSPRTYGAACRTCHGVGTQQVPRPEKLIINPEKPLCGGAMYSPGFFPKGYLGKPFNGGYYMVQALARRYRFDPDHTPWQQMSAEAQQAFLYGDPKPMRVVYENRRGIVTERNQPFPGFYGFIRDWDVGGTYTETEPCPQCHGACLRPEYLAVTLGGSNVHKLQQMPLFRLQEVLREFSTHFSQHQLGINNINTILRRLCFLLQVGLGYLHLGRLAGTLSAGEAQRIKLAGLLGSGLTSLTVLLDEPSRGLHAREVDALINALKDLCGEGNTVIVVEHEPAIIRSADYVIEMGPGAGKAGGEVVAQGAAAQVLSGETLTARCLRGSGWKLGGTRRSPREWMRIVGARANNLCGETIEFPLGVLTGVCGVSGSGKSSLVIDTLGRALAPEKQTTSVAYKPVDPGVHDRIESAPQRVVVVDQARSGVHSPAAFLGLDRELRLLYAASSDARAMGLDEKHLAKTCTACNGRGVEHTDMGFLPSVYSPCEVCRGTGFAPEAWQVRLNGLALPDLNDLTLDEIYDMFKEEPNLVHALRAARMVGLGYLALYQPGFALSGGEAQRLKIARELSHKSGGSTLYILDEPTVGQHLADVQRLADVFQHLVEDGASVLVVEHHPHLLATCDWLVELGPGGGPHGGRVVASGTPKTLAAGNTPTAFYLRSILEGGS